MRRFLLQLKLITNGRAIEKIVPETMVDEELVRLTKITPRTQAERQFHAWLVKWKEKQNKEG